MFTRARRREDDIVRTRTWAATTAPTGAVSFPPMPRASMGNVLATCGGAGGERCIMCTQHSPMPPTVAHERPAALREGFGGQNGGHHRDRSTRFVLVWYADGGVWYVYPQVWSAQYNLYPTSRASFWRAHWRAGVGGLISALVEKTGAHSRPNLEISNSQNCRAESVAVHVTLFAHGECL